ncbi:hypothetical protein HWV62_17410 [Athelia sp. TMB]|nr:hypothetical protein HWV62_17410 [Athelia sp. TMB]
MPSPDLRVIIMGAGVIGLSIAHTLASDPSNTHDITIIARDMPEDLSSQAWASPWAGAWAGGSYKNIDGDSEDKNDQQKWENQTYKRFLEMIHTQLIKITPSRIFSLNEDEFIAGGKDVPRDAKILPPEEIPAPYKSGMAFNILALDPLKYLPFLKAQLESFGVKFVRQRLGSVEDVAEAVGSTGILVNALGMAYADSGRCYMIPRPGTDDTVLLGGTVQEHNWDTSHNERISEDIFKRCAVLDPRLLDKHNIKILSHNVGLRSARTGGPRVEIEAIRIPLEDHLVSRIESQPLSNNVLRVVHAYGFGSDGYLQSWGAAEEAVRLIKYLGSSDVAS